MARVIGFWVILAGNTPTAFRAKDRDTLLPTFKQLQRTQPTVSIQWFERNRLWNSPEEARAALIARREQEGGRTREWRPGGSHEDPRAKYQLSRDQKRARFKRNARGPFPPPERAGGPPPADLPPGTPPPDRPVAAKPHRPPRPDWRRDGQRPQGGLRRDRPGPPRSDRPGPPRSDRPGPPRSDRPWGKPASDRPRPPRPEWRRDGQRPPGGPRRDRPPYGPPKPKRGK
jgi:hypothetical protein